MARNLRDIRRKMKAIKSTKQVTKAMELVAASKMRRAVQNAHLLRRYALTAWNILERVSGATKEEHPFLTPRAPKRTLVILFTSDRGLCGSLNTQMFRLVQQYENVVRALPEFESIEFIAVGRKGQQFLARTGRKVAAAFPALSNHPKFKDILPISRMALDGFLNKQYDQIALLYPQCVTALSQLPTAQLLLPLSRTELRAQVEKLTPASGAFAQSAHKEKSRDVDEFAFEPSAIELLQTIIPQLTETQIFQAVLQSTASEHSARMVAMRNATDNASSILDDLTLMYNQTRQANITSELAELTASRTALS
jgi:F-type H+-transporting ATPase subunit gamma